ncbi:hypothetical protein MJI69_29055, partial [Salmonella enterica subsp. enterica serovar Anatum]|nr:hypothetical protein [Salmonella enterica subsp. enterica serovar Anatum]
VAREIQHFIAELADYLELENHMPRAFTEAQAEAMVTIVFSAGRAAKEAQPEAYIVGEHFGDARQWLQADAEDAAMNYRGFTFPL